MEKKISEQTRDKATVSARINKHVYDIYKESEIPLSLVIEASLINFMKLTDEEKITFLNQNNVENTEAKELKIPKLKWNNLLKSYLQKMTIPSSVITSLFTGVAVGAIAVIASYLVVGNEDSVIDETEPDYLNDDIQ